MARRPNPAALLQLPHMIRFRLTIWYTGLAAFVLAAFVGGVIYAFSQYQFDNLDARAAAQLTDTFMRQLQVAPIPQCLGRTGLGHEHAPIQQACYAVKIHNPDALNKSESYVQFYTADGQPVLDPNGKPVRQPNNSPLDTGTADRQKRAAKNDPTGTKLAATAGQYHYITIPLVSTETGERIIGQIAAPISHVQDQVDALMRILIYAAGVLLVISAAGGWLLAGRALRPIDEITRRARQITVHDLSQRINLEQEDELGRMAATFDELIGRLQDAFDRQKRFTSDASHELRTPLTVMQADLSLALARPRSAADYRETLVSMDEEVSRLAGIVNDLLMLTRIDVDPAGMQYQPVPLHELLSGLVNRVRVIAGERAITVAADTLDPVTVLGDSTRLRQLFTNLLDNAVTYTPDGGRVAISVERTRDGARVLVSDTGIGIAPEHVPHVFDRFYRTTAAREQNPHGTGLGLAISRSVVRAHRGDISVQSTPGEGTTFTVTLLADSRRRVRRNLGLRALIPSGASAQ